MQNETILRLIMSDTYYIEGKSSDIMHLFPFKDGTINTRYRGVCTHQEGGKTEIRFTLFHENEGIQQVVFPGDTAALFLAFLLKRGLLLDVFLDELQITEALREGRPLSQKIHPGKPGCEHHSLLVRCYDEQCGRVYLLGDDVKDGVYHNDPECTGEVEVECQEEDCNYFQGFSTWEWENAPEPLRSRIAKAVDEYYS